MKLLLSLILAFCAIAGDSRSVTYDSVTRLVAPTGITVSNSFSTTPTTDSGIANKSYVDSHSLSQGWVNVKNAPYNAQGNGGADDTEAIQSAINSGLNVFIPSGNYKITTSLTNSMYQKINGQGRDTTKITSTSTNAALVFHSTLGQGDINANFELKDLSIYAKNAVEINQIGIPSWDDQGRVLNIRLIHCTFYGTYAPLDDPYARTTNAPSLASLVDFGVGLKMSKMYDSLVQNCYFRGFGLAIYLDACDINNIDTCRFAYNARHVYLEKHDHEGSQNTIQNCDILVNYRVYGIYEYKTAYNTIQNNYFECNLESSCYWKNDRGEGTIFSNNRIDAPVGTIPVISIDTEGAGVIISNNRGARNRTIEVLHNNWFPDDGQQTFVAFQDNLVSFPEPLYPQCTYAQYTSPRVWGPYSPKRMLGNAITNYPWGLTTDGLPGISTITAAESLIVLMDTSATDEALEISMTGEMPGGGFVTIAWGGTNVWASDWFTSTNLQTVSRQIIKPVGVLPNSGLSFTVAPNQGYLCGISLTQSPTNIQGGTLTISNTSTLLGRTIIQASAPAGGPLAYFPGWQISPITNGAEVLFRDRVNYLVDLGDGAATGNNGLVLKNNATLDTTSFTGSTTIETVHSSSAFSYYGGWISNPSSGGSILYWRTPAEVRSDIGAGTGSGSVSSVALTVPSGFSVSGSPVTTSGTFAISTSLSGHVSGDGSGLTASATIPSADIAVNENTQTGTTYTVSSTDNGKVVTLNNASAITVTVPTLSAGFSCTFVQKGSGQVTFSASGTTINNAHSQTKTYGQYSAVTLYGLSSTSFDLAGDTGP